jgi:hypothetical protein
MIFGFIIDYEQIIKRLLYNDIKLPSYKSILDWAIGCGYLKIVKYIDTRQKIDQLINIDLAFQLATTRGHLKIMKYLLTLPKVQAEMHNMIIDILNQEDWVL